MHTQAQLRNVLLAIHTDLEQSPQAQFLYACRPRPVLMSAEALVPNFVKAGVPFAVIFKRTPVPISTVH